MFLYVTNYSVVNFTLKQENFNDVLNVQFMCSFQRMLREHILLDDFAAVAGAGGAT